MRSVAFVLCLAATCHAATTKNVTVLVNFDHPYSSVSITALRHELHRLLEPTGISAEVVTKAELPDSPQLSEIVVFEMKGSCTMAGDFAEQPEFGGPLGKAYTTNGHVLHFGEVQCDRIRHSLQRITLGSRPEIHQAQYGTALGIVLAHEIYHMLTDAKAHTKNGLTKESLSAWELLDGDLSLPSIVRESMRLELLASSE